MLQRQHSLGGYGQGDGLLRHCVWKKEQQSQALEEFMQVKTAPMIKQCPINMECKLIQIVDFPKHDIFIGEIVKRT